MVHLHGLGLSHLARRQRNRNHDDGDVTVVVTMKNTFTGDVVWVTKGEPPKTLAPPLTRADPTPTPTFAPKKPVSSSSRSSPSSSKKEEPDPDETEKPSSSAASEKSTSSLPSATSSPPTVSSQVNVIETTASPTPPGIASATNASSPIPSAEAAGSSGMSGGAKAGVALGVLLAVAAILGAILFVYRRNKKNAHGQKDDDEKFAMQNAPPPPAPQVTTVPAFNEPAPSSSPSTAPRLSLRPVTQFDPALPNGGIAAAAAVAPAANQNRSAWERTGASNASSAPVNPFNDPQPARSASPPANPFDNSAAIPRSPTSPMAADPKFGNPAPAIAAATAVAAAAPAAKPAVQPAVQPKEPISPTWTDDIPASPGPAPSGPLPIAANARSGNGPAPAPNTVHRVQLDFKPSMGDELELRAGQLVRMLHEYDDGWALCIRMDRSQQGVVPRTCLSKLPVKPRTGGPPRQPQQPHGGPGTPRMRGPPPPGASPRPLSPASGRNSPHPPALSPGNGRMSPGPRAMSPNPNRQGPPPQGRNRSQSNAPYAGQPRSMSPGPYGGGPQHMGPPPPMGRPRSNSAGGATRRGPQPGGPGLSPMNPNANAPMPNRKPLPGQAM